MDLSIQEYQQQCQFLEKQLSTLQGDQVGTWVDNESQTGTTEQELASDLHVITEGLEIKVDMCGVCMVDAQRRGGEGDVRRSWLIIISMPCLAV